MARATRSGKQFSLYELGSLQIDGREFGVVRTSASLDSLVAEAIAAANTREAQLDALADSGQAPGADDEWEDRTIITAIIRARISPTFTIPCTLTHLARLHLPMHPHPKPLHAHHGQPHPARLHPTAARRLSAGTRVRQLVARLARRGQMPPGRHMIASQITQYAAGGLFCWGAYSFQTAKDLLATEGGREAKDKFDGAPGARWRWAMGLFSKIDELEGNRAAAFGDT
ncbi:hypothetical protein C8R43DRAFT_944828 [Mycena crocata]|nr:hypothetical protein C8R43DRAFT_944828 [Mycena crocata]